jgi:hypothetical protein
MPKSNSKYQSKSSAKKGGVAPYEAAEPDPSHVPDSGALTTTDQLAGENEDGTRKEDVNAEEKEALAESKKGKAEKEELVTVDFTSDVNVRLDKKDYVGSHFEKLKPEEAERLREHVRELHGPGRLA